MNLPLIIIFIGLLIFGAHFFNALFRFTKIPNGLLLLAIGIIIGPLTKLVSVNSFGEVGSVFTTVTLILLLFESGINLKIGELIKSIGSSFMITLFNFVITATIGTIIALFFGENVSFMLALFFGIIIAGTSSAVVIPMIKQLKMNKKGETILLLESALSDVFCLVIGLSVFEALKSGNLNVGIIGNSIWKSFLLAGGIGIIGGKIWSFTLNFLRKNVENNIFTNLAFGFIIYGLSEYWKLNGGIAILMFGITLGNAHLFFKKLPKSIAPQPITDREKHFFSELVFIMATFFFVYVGLQMNFNNYMPYLAALIIVIAVTVIRPLSVKFFVKQKMPHKELSVMSIMAPKGLVPAVLATVPVQASIAGATEVQNMAYATVLVSIVVCALLVVMFSKNAYAIPFVGKLNENKALTEEKIQVINLSNAPENNLKNVEIDTSNKENNNNSYCQ